MTLLPKDRRGLAETVAISSVLIVFGTLALVAVLNGTPITDLPPWLTGTIIGAAVSIGILGVKGAAERSATSESYSRESSELRAAAASFEDKAKRLEALADRIFDREVERQLPPMRIGDKS